MGEHGNRRDLYINSPENPPGNECLCARRGGEIGSENERKRTKCKGARKRCRPYFRNKRPASWGPGRVWDEGWVGEGLSEGGASGVARSTGPIRSAASSDYRLESSKPGLAPGSQGRRRRRGIERKEEEGRGLQPLKGEECAGFEGWEKTAVEHRFPAWLSW